MSISLCQFWNCKSIPLQIVYPFSISWKITPLYFFSSKNIYFAQKESIKIKIFETCTCSGQKFVKFLISIWKWPVSSFSNFASSSLTWHITPLWIVSSYFFYFGLRDPIKVPILKLSSALVKICHILHFIFQTTKKYSLYFLGQTLNTLHNRSK